MRYSRRGFIALAATATAVSACRDPQTPTRSGTPAPPSVSPTPTPTPTQTPSPSPSALPLTAIGQARKAIKELRTAAGDYPIVKIDVAATVASLSVLIDKEPHTWRWEKGAVSEVTSDLEYINQSAFEPDDYALTNVGLLFDKAAIISGSSSNQELQIVEFNQGQVLMTVTTNPESRPVFFRPDGTPVNDVDFTTAEGIREALSDAVGGRKQLMAVGYQSDQIIWAEAPLPEEPGVILRRTRGAKVPTFISSRKQTPSMGLFSPADIDPEMLADLMQTITTIANKPATTKISYVIDMRYKRPLPTIQFDVGGKIIVTDLAGRDITSEVR